MYNEKIVKASPNQDGLGRFFRGPSPRNASEMAFLRGLGVQIVVCLQEGFTDLFRGTSRRDLWEAEWAYRWMNICFSNFFPPTRDECQLVGEVVHFQREGRFDVLLCCKRGKDRTGFICGIYEVIYRGVPADVAWGMAADYGMAWHYKWLWKKAFFRVATELASET